MLLQKREILDSGDEEQAIAEFRKALEYFRKNIHSDPSEQEARINTAEAALELGNVLQGTNPPAALAAYDEAIASLRAMPNENSRYRRKASLLR